MRNNRGFSLAELLVVFLIMGVVASLTFPRMRDAFYKNNIRGARAAVTNLVARARGVAVARGCRTIVAFTSGMTGKVWVVSCKDIVTVATSQRDTIGKIENVAQAFNVNITAGRDSIQFDPRGLEIDFVSTTITYTEGSFTDSTVINAAGKVTH